jgi:serine/threonine protein kinase
MALCGKMLGKFQIQEPLGAGECGAVYRALDVVLKRSVALKVLSPWDASHSGTIERFLREARLAAKLDHPNIIRVHHVGTKDGYCYIEMELVEGSSVADLIETHPQGLPEAQALNIALQIANGLQAAHDEANFIHRDIKPSNVLVTRSGTVKLVDFGIARPIGEGAHASLSTTTGLFLGTTAYASPEQCRGEAPDCRSDIYSFGATLYHMLTGAPPIPPAQGENELQLLNRIVTEEPAPIQQKVCGLNPNLSAVVMRMLAKQPSDRYQSVRAVRHDLKAVKDGRPLAGVVVGKQTRRVPLPPSPSMPSGLRWLLAVSLGLAALLVCGVAVWWIAKQTKTPSSLVVPHIAENGPAPSSTNVPAQSIESAVTPRVNSVEFSGTLDNYRLMITGSGFGTLPGQNLPFRGTTSFFRIADAAQLGFGEWGYAGDAKTLYYQSWSDTRIQVSSFGGQPEDAVTMEVWNPTSGACAAWGGNVIPGMPSAPRITSVSFSGSAEKLQIIVQGSGFGNAPAVMPFTGNLNYFSFGDYRPHAGGGNCLFRAGCAGWGVRSADLVTLHYQSWSDKQIFVNGFAGQYGQGPATVQDGDPVEIIIWNSQAAGKTGAQTAWGGVIGGRQEAVLGKGVPQLVLEKSAPTAGNQAMAEPQLFASIPKDPADDSTLRVVSGTGDFASVSATNKRLTARPGENLNGTVSLQALNTMPSWAIAPLIYTPSWGDHRTSFREINHWIPRGKSQQVAQISLIAPSVLGVYHIIFAFSGEKSPDQIAAFSNWSAGATGWNDAGDLAALSDAQLSEAMLNGHVRVRYRWTQGYHNRDVAIDALTFTVLDQPRKDSRTAAAPR